MTIENTLQLKQERYLQTEQIKLAAGISDEHSKKSKQSLQQNLWHSTTEMAHWNPSITETIINAAVCQLKNAAKDLLNDLTKQEHVAQSLNAEMLKR